MIAIITIGSNSLRRGIGEVQRIDFSRCSYKSTYDQYKGVTTLTILNTCQEDEGEYTCTAVNALGESSTSGSLLTPGKTAI